MFEFKDPHTWHRTAGDVMLVRGRHNPLCSTIDPPWSTVLHHDPPRSTMIRQVRCRVLPNVCHALGCTLRAKPLWHRCFLAWKMCVARRRRGELREIVPITAETTFAEVRVAPHLVNPNPNPIPNP